MRRESNADTACLDVDAEGQGKTQERAKEGELSVAV